MGQLVDLRDAKTARRVMSAARRRLASSPSTLRGYAIESGKRAAPALVALVEREIDRHGPAAVDAAEYLEDDALAGQLLALDAHVVGALTTQPATAPVATPSSLREALRPAPPGCSVAHVALPGAGSIGAWLCDAAGAVYFLSNNHVLALETGQRDAQTIGGRFGVAHPGDLVTQPGDEPPRARTQSDLFARLIDFIPLGYAGQSAPANYCDAALAQPFEASWATAGVPLLGAGGGAIRPTTITARIRESDRVYKVGRTSAATVGTVRFVDATIRMPYDAGDVIFDRQVVTTAMSAAGDSGSLVIASDGSAAGLLIGGSSEATLWSPLLTIVQLFSARLGRTLTLLAA